MAGRLRFIRRRRRRGRVRDFFARSARGSTFFACFPAFVFAGVFAGLSGEPGATAAEFFELAERPLSLVSEGFLLGMAMFFRVEESHHGAVERVAMVRAETVAGPGAAQAAMPGGSRSARGHEGDAAGHGRRNEMRKAKFENGKSQIEIQRTGRGVRAMRRKVARGRAVMRAAVLMEALANCTVRRLRASASGQTGRKSRCRSSGTVSAMNLRRWYRARPRRAGASRARGQSVWGFAA
jgi:hypothetical protein